MTILISTNHIGRALRNARRSLYWNEPDVAKLLGVTEKTFQQYEMGTTVMPYEQLQQIFTMGLMMMRARQLQAEYNNHCAKQHKSSEQPCFVTPNATRN